MLRYLSYIALLLLAAIHPARAADVLALDVDEDQGRYTVSFDAVVKAPIAVIYPVMLTPARWPQLSGLIADARVLADLPGGRRKISMTFHDCVLIFCKTFRKVEELSTAGDGRIDTVAIPAQSDFSYASEHWHITADGNNTRIRYRAEMAPSFFVPPLIGPYILKTKMRSLLIHTAENLELLAHP